MDINTAKQTLDELERRQYAYRHAMSIIMNDASTVAPPESYEPRGVAVGVLAAENAFLVDVRLEGDAGSRGISL